MATIDLDKTTEAFDYLAETDSGRAALATFESAVDALQSSIEPGLNRGEFVTVLRGLTQGMTLEEQDDEVSGFSFNPVDVQKFAAGEIRRVDIGSSFMLPARNIGAFNIKGAA